MLWPYICFSGLENFLLVVNLYDRKRVQRIELDKEKVQVCQTIISNSKDLFVVLRDKDNFMVKTLDLDEINSGEHKTLDENNFRLKLICFYPISMVNGKDLSSMYVRGSSKKEAINSNEKLMIFLHH